MIRTLEVLTGCWFGTTRTLAPSSLCRVPAATTYKAQFDLAGSVVVASEYRKERDRLVYQALHVLGWDADRQEYTLHLFDTHRQRVVVPAFGTWRGHTLTLERATKKKLVRFEYFFEGPTTHRFRISTAQHGNTCSPVVESTYERLGQ